MPEDVVTLNIALLKWNEGEKCTSQNNPASHSAHKLENINPKKVRKNI